MTIWAWIVDHAAPLAIIGSMITIAGFALGFFRRPAARFRQRVWNPILEANTAIPRNTLVIQRGDRRSTFWAEGKQGDQSLMRVRISLHLSNVADRPVQVSKVWLCFRRNGIFREEKEGDLTIPEAHGPLWGQNPIPPGQMTEGIAHWFVFPPFARPKDVLSVRVRVVDEFGNRCSSEAIKIRFVDDVRRVY